LELIPKETEKFQGERGTDSLSSAENNGVFHCQRIHFTSRVSWVNSRNLARILKQDMGSRRNGKDFCNLFLQLRHLPAYLSCLSKFVPHICSRTAATEERLFQSLKKYWKQKDRRVQALLWKGAPQSLLMQ